MNTQINQAQSCWIQNGSLWFRGLCTALVVVSIIKEEIPKMCLSCLFKCMLYFILFLLYAGCYKKQYIHCWKCISLPSLIGAYENWSAKTRSPAVLSVYLLSHYAALLSTIRVWTSGFAAVYRYTLIQNVYLAPCASEPGQMKKDLFQPNNRSNI